MEDKKYIKTFKLLLPYLWPKKRNDLRTRVSFAVVALVLAKIASVSTPLVLGEAVNSLTELSAGINLFMLVPVALIVGYGVARIISFTFVAIRDALFSKVSQHSIRQISLNMFKHLHNLSLQFHLNRQTGALAKYIDRGTKGIDFLLRYVLFNVVPTFFEIFLVSGILFYLYGPWYAVVTLTTIGLYSYLTFQITEWRNVFRKRMNQADNNISTKMIDSLLNFETVKYFNNEAYEFNRLDKSLEDYELAANQSRHSLSLLNIAQTFIIMLGITIMLVMSAFGIKNGDIDVGGFVVINAYMLQLYQPLNFLGSVYREIRQALTDMENMFSLLEVSQVSKDDLEDMPQSNVAEIRFDKVSFDYDIRRTIIKNISFTVPNGKKVAIVGPTGAGKSTISRLLFKFYDPKEGGVYINNININKITININKHPIIYFNFYLNCIKCSSLEIIRNKQSYSPKFPTWHLTELLQNLVIISNEEVDKDCEFGSRAGYYIWESLNYQTIVYEEALRLEETDKYNATFESLGRSFYYILKNSKSRKIRVTAFEMLASVYFKNHAQGELLEAALHGIYGNGVKSALIDAKYLNDLLPYKGDNIYCCTLSRNLTDKLLS